MTIQEIIEQRKSVRSFSGEPLTADQRYQLETAIKEATSPFGSDFSIKLKDFDLKGAYKPSTYGVITGARSFLLMAVGSTETAPLAAGYAMEQVVLKATELGLGTCWIAATFRGSDFDRDEHWPEGQALKIISPIGEPSGKKSLLERVTHFSLRSAKRRPFDQLFFQADGKTPLPETNQFAEALQMLRLAPSSTNSQPWRAIVDGQDVHFFSISSADVAKLNVGIGLSHFTLTEQALGHQGSFSSVPNHPGTEAWIYLTSYRRK